MTCGATFSMLFDIIIITSLQTQLFHDIQYLEEDLAGGAGQYFNLICSKQKRFDMEYSSEIWYGILIRGRGFSPFGMNDSCGSSRIFFWQDSSKFEITGVVYNQKHIQLLLNIKVPVLMLFVLFKFQSKAISVLRLLRNISIFSPPIESVLKCVWNSVLVKVWKWFWWRFENGQTKIQRSVNINRQIHHEYS